MAYSDLNIATATGGNLLGGADGNARTHASLTNPLTGEGSYCREFVRDVGADQNRCTVDAAYDGGSLVEIPDTKAISVRAWVRLSSSATNSLCSGVGAKMDLSETLTGSYNQAPYGYMVHIGSFSSGAPSGGFNTINLTMYNRKTGASVGDRYVNLSTGASISNIPTISADTWYKIRMDVVPVGPVEDRIDVYTGTGATGSETWTLHHEETVLNSSNYYIPWGEVGGGEVGFFGLSGLSSQSSFIDRFQVFLTDV